MTEGEKRVVSVVVMFAVAVAVTLALVQLSKRKPCVERGEAYFKEIGSWPRLSNGSDSATVVRTRCARTDNAFPD